MLQLSLDWMKLEDAIRTVENLYEKIDIVEVGTPIIFEYGLDSVAKMKELFPEKMILADMKIIDAGKRETEMAVKKGADIITVMGAANDYTIQTAIEAAHHFGKKIMVDVLGIHDIAARARTIENLEADYICVHTAFDMKEKADRPINELEIAASNCDRTKTAIAGGITLNEIESIMLKSPDIVIIGGGILDAANPLEVINQFYSFCGGGK